MTAALPLPPGPRVLRRAWLSPPRVPGSGGPGALREGSAGATVPPHPARRSADPHPGPPRGMAPGLLDLVHLTTCAVCAVIKLPQLVAVLRAGSAWGLSVSSLLLELAG